MRRWRDIDLIILFIIGGIASIIGSLIGIGGGLIIVPSLLYFSLYSDIYVITPQVAIGTSLVVVLITGVSSTLAYIKRKKVDIKSGLYFFSASGPGAIVGAYLSRYFNIDVFSIYFGSLLIFLSLFLIYSRNLNVLNVKPTIERIGEDESGNHIVYGYSLKVALPLSFLVGAISGLFGIGGGALLVPVMVYIFYFPSHIAIATSMFIIFLSSISGVLMHAYLGNINWIAVLFLGLGAWFGAKIGVAINSKFKTKNLMLILRIILIIIGIQFIFDGFM